MFKSRSDRETVDAWVNSQEVCPTRKQTKRQFPNINQKHIRASIQSRKDRES